MHSRIPRHFPYVVLKGCSRSLRLWCPQLPIIYASVYFIYRKGLIVKVIDVYSIYYSSE